MPETQVPLERRIAAHVDALCGFGPDRFPGTEANRQAVHHVANSMRELGLSVESLTFETVGWERGSAWIDLGGGRSVELHPGPFSPPLDSTEVRLLTASTADDLAAMDARGAALVLHGGVASEQLTPRGYPFYENPPHTAILDAIEHAAPVAVIAATGKNPATTAALSPFPLIEDAAFPLPSAYLAEEEVAALLEHAASDRTATLNIDSEQVPASGEQVVGRLGALGSHRRVIVCAHIDTKPDTPGALDNASGVATLLAITELLATDPPEGVAVELVPFNGEDHYSAPGEMAYVAAYPPDETIALVINIDGTGLAGAPSSVSTYGLASDTGAAVADLLARHPGVEPGDPWFASDHAIFAMGGTPAIAITSGEFARMNEEFAHTESDTPDLVDSSLLADAARFVTALVRAIA